MLAGIVALAGEKRGADPVHRRRRHAAVRASEQVTAPWPGWRTFRGGTVEDMERSDQAQRALLGRVHDLGGLNGAFELMGGGKCPGADCRPGRLADVLSFDPARQERALRQAVRDAPFVELLY
jgi:methyl-accepting chemotaxis protein